MKVPSHAAQRNSCVSVATPEDGLDMPVMLSTTCIIAMPNAFAVSVFSAAAVCRL